MVKKKPTAWFKAVRGSYLPQTTAGWLTYFPFLAYLAAVAVAAFAVTNSNLLAVLCILPNWIAAGAAMTYFAARKS